MKILVFDDTAIQRRAAAAMLKEHEVTVVSTYDEAQKALTPQTDYDEVRRLMNEAMAKLGYAKDFNPHDEKLGEDKRKAFWAARDKEWNKAMEAVTTHPDFDAVLTDLMVPASRQAQGDESYHLVGKEMPLGAIIALLAISNGVKKVAVVTDINHHKHPASAAFDCFCGANGSGEVKVLCTNRCTCSFDTVSGQKVEPVDWNNKEASAEFERRRDAGELVTVKNWAEALADLTGQTADQSAAE